MEQITIYYRPEYKVYTVHVLCGVCHTLQAFDIADRLLREAGQSHLSYVLQKIAGKLEGCSECNCLYDTEHIICELENFFFKEGYFTPNRQSDNNEAIKILDKFIKNIKKEEKKYETCSTLLR